MGAKNKYEPGGQKEQLKPGEYESKYETGGLEKKCTQ